MSFFAGCFGKIDGVQELGGFMESVLPKFQPNSSRH